MLAFALICAASGAALAADMVLLPAIFARHLAQTTPEAGQAMGFGLWSFVSKLTLALAAATLLPILQAQGFNSGGLNPEAALETLTLLYAALPCVLKLVAIALLAATPVLEGMIHDPVMFVLLGMAMTAALVVLHTRTLGFRAQKPAEYKGKGPHFDLRRHLNGPIQCEGVIYGPTGRVTSRFVADMHGDWDGNIGTLRERFPL